VIPPHEGVPADGAACGRDNDGCPSAFDFRRLGSRVASFLVSPWVAKGKVIQRPTGPQPTSQFELASICSTAKTLFNLSSFRASAVTRAPALFIMHWAGQSRLTRGDIDACCAVTERDAWAGSFEELLLDSPRPDSDCPLHLPDAPEPWRPPPEPHETNVSCGEFVKGDGCHGGKYEALVVEWTTEQQCRAACEEKAKAVGRPGCCWHSPVQRNVTSCQWITGGTHDVAGQPSIRSAADCKGTPGGARRNLGVPGREEGQGFAPPIPRHCPAQQPGACPLGVTVSQRRKVAELGARVGVQLPELELMTEADVDRWLAHTLAKWLHGE
jgi:hypothetical protein